MMRNAPGPYNTGSLGYNQNMNYDCNLICNPPPNYPGFGPGCTNEHAINFDVFATVDNNSCIFLLGDLNFDDTIDVIDIVILVNLILNG